MRNDASDPADALDGSPPRLAEQDALLRTAAERPRQATPTVSFLLRLPDDLYRELEAVAQRDQTTMTAIIARALKAAGFSVPPSALDDRRRRRRTAAPR